MNKIVQFCNMILQCCVMLFFDVLHNDWSTGFKEFDKVWFGYNTLQDILVEKGFLTVSIKQLKHAMLILKKRKYVELKPTYNVDGRINERGWFSCI